VGSIVLNPATETAHYHGLEEGIFLFRNSAESKNCENEVNGSAITSNYNRLISHSSQIKHTVQQAEQYGPPNYKLSSQRQPRTNTYWISAENHVRYSLVKSIPLSYTDLNKKSWKQLMMPTLELSHRIHVIIIDMKKNVLPVTVVVRSEAWVLASLLLGSWVRIPLKAWMFVRVFLCCVVLCR
jgi:hypothetical protein